MKVGLTLRKRIGMMLTSPSAHKAQLLDELFRIPGLLVIVTNARFELNLANDYFYEYFDCKPEMLCQFAVLGSIYAKNVLGINNPRVALLSNGEEDEKGNLLTLSANGLMKQMRNINFVGNIEGNKLYSGKIADVVVCDGFVGNIALKQAEAMYVLTQKLGVRNEFFDRFNYELYGGTPVLGVNSTVIIGHGHSSVEAIRTMILQTENVIKAQLAEKVKQALNTDV